MKRTDRCFIYQVFLLHKICLSIKLNKPPNLVEDLAIWLSPERGIVYIFYRCMNDAMLEVLLTIESMV